MVPCFRIENKNYKELEREQREQQLKRKPWLITACQQSNASMSMCPLFAPQSPEKFYVLQSPDNFLDFKNLPRKKKEKKWSLGEALQFILFFWAFLAAVGRVITMFYGLWFTCSSNIFETFNLFLDTLHRSSRIMRS